MDGLAPPAAPLLPAALGASSVRCAAPAASAAPIQMVFEFKGKSDQGWFWVDSDTNALYRWKPGMAHGPFGPNGMPVWVHVARKDGFSLTIRNTGAATQYAPEVIDAEHEQIRMNPGSYAPPEKVARPTLTPSDDYEMKVEEAEPVTKSSFTQGTTTAPDYRAEAEQQIEQFHSTRIQNPLLAQFHLVPIAQGLVNPQSILSQYEYPAGAVGIGGVMMGDADRILVGTHLEPKKAGGATPQGKHTVAWALVRKSIEGQRGRTVAEALAHIKSELAAIVPLATASPEAGFHLKRLGYPETLDRLIGSKMTIDRWQADLSELVNVYIQLYHLCQGAMFAGASKQRGESKAVKAFSEAEDQLAAGVEMTKPLDGKGGLIQHALNLIEAPIGSLPAKTFAFAVFHWVVMLTTTWPRVMTKHGEAITKSLLQATYSPCDELPAGGTVTQLITALGYTLPVWADVKQPKKVEGEAHIATASYGRLEENFVANVHVYPFGEGEAKGYSTTWGGGSVLIQERGYPVGQIGISALQVSDRDRPPTQFLGAGQKSHTVAWTLMRDDLSAYGGGPLVNLLNFLANSLTKLEGESPVADGKALAQKALVELARRDTLRLTLGDWQNYASTLVKWYVHVYQAARSTAYADPRTHGRPESHGEGPHMDTLWRNERSMVERGTMGDEPAHVIKAALAFYDVCIPKEATVNVSNETRFMLAYDIWKERLFHTFPKIMAAGWPHIYEALAKVDVGWKVSESELRYHNEESRGRGVGKVHLLGEILKRNGRNA
jgi:hypothetical protein